MNPQPPTAVDSPSHRVVRAGHDDIDGLSHVIADAFYNLAVSQWLIPDPDARRDIFPGYFRLYVELAITAGIVHTTSARTAAALWIPISEQRPAASDSDFARLAAATGRWAERLGAFDQILERHHPAEYPHHHLAILAVRPDKQGQGVGTALLDAHHAALDRKGMPAYLEASGRDTCRVYLRHGYLLRPNAPIRLPDGGPEMFPMWREPRRRCHA